MRRLDAEISTETRDMNLILQDSIIENYLKESDIIDFNNALLAGYAHRLVDGINQWVLEVSQSKAFSGAGAFSPLLQHNFFPDSCGFIDRIDYFHDFHPISSGTDALCTC